MKEIMLFISRWNSVKGALELAWFFVAVTLAHVCFCEKKWSSKYFSEQAYKPFWVNMAKVYL